MKSRRRGPSSTTPLELQDFLCFALYSTRHAFNRVYRPLLKNVGLTYLQFIALILLWEQDGQTVGELGQKLVLQSNTLTPMLKRLESRGSIKGNRDAVDERQVRVNLTEAGRTLRLRAPAIVQTVRNAIGLQDMQVTELLEKVDKLRSALEGENSW